MVWLTIALRRFIESVITFIVVTSNTRVYTNYVFTNEMPFTKTIYFVEFHPNEEG